MTMITRLWSLMNPSNLFKLLYKTWRIAANASNHQKLIIYYCTEEMMSVGDCFTSRYDRRSN